MSGMAAASCAVASMPLPSRMVMSISTRSTVAPAGQRQRLGAGAGFGHDAEMRHRFQARAQAVAHQRMVVDQHDVDVAASVVSVSWFVMRPPGRRWRTPWCRRPTMRCRAGRRSRPAARSCCAGRCRAAGAWPRPRRRSRRRRRRWSSVHARRARRAAPASMWRAPAWRSIFVSASCAMRNSTVATAGGRRSASPVAANATGMPLCCANSSARCSSAAARPEVVQQGRAQVVRDAAHLAQHLVEFLGGALEAGARLLLLVRRAGQADDAGLDLQLDRHQPLADAVVQVARQARPLLSPANRPRAAPAPSAWRRRRAIR